MKPEPPRLADDPSFLAETGCNLGDEPAALEAPRLPELRARLMASIAEPKLPRRSSPWPWVGGGLLLLAVSWVLWQGWTPPPALVPVPVPSPLSPAPAAAPGVEGAARVPDPRPAPVAAPAPEPAERRPPVHVATAATVPPVAPTPPALSAPPAPPTVPPATATPADSGDLARQLAAFELGEDQFADGDPSSAIASYDAYLKRWPNGHFRGEAEIAKLRATAAMGDASGAEAIAARLAEDPALATRRDEIVALRCSALARLGRCEEALALAKALPGVARAKVAAACR